MIYRFSDFHNHWVVVVRASSEMMALDKLRSHLRSFGKEHLMDKEYPEFCCGNLDNKNILFSTLDPDNQPTKLGPEKVPVGVCGVPINLDIFSQ